MKCIAKILRNTFTGNTAENYGGTLYITSGTYMFVSYVVFFTEGHNMRPHQLVKCKYLRPFLCFGLMQ